MTYELSYPEAMQVIGGLSNTSKMPWYSWSTSAYDCITGSKLREVEGSVCSNCYAMKGCYVFSSVRNAHNRRLSAIDDPRFVDAFVVVLTNLYLRTRKTYTKDGVTIKENRFRWHDAGDIQSVEHLMMINSIAMQCPFIDFWLPTKEVGFVNKFLKNNTPAKNLTIRLSNPMIGGTWEKKPNGQVFSTVGVQGAEMQCPAYQQEGKCGDCRNCWNKDVDAVNYPLH